MRKAGFVKIVIFQGGFGAGGAEKTVALLARHRAALGDEVLVVGAVQQDEECYFPYPDDVRREVLRTGPSSGLSVAARRTGAIRGVVRREKPDLVLSFLTKINVLTLCATVGQDLPVIISERNNPEAQFAHPVWRYGQLLLMRRAEAIVTLTERGLVSLPPEARRKALAIANPCEILPGVTPPAEGKALRFIAVGRLVQQKGFDLLLRAFGRVRAAEPDARLTIFGEGPERDALEALRHELRLDDHVDMPGISTEVGSWVSQGDVLLVSSRHEGLCNVIVEATVSGLPVISFDCDFGPREVILDGVNGRLVPPEDVSALAEAALELVDRPEVRRRMYEARHINAEKYAPSAILPLWDAVIERAVAPSGVGSCPHLQMAGRP